MRRSPKTAKAPPVRQDSRPVPGTLVPEKRIEQAILHVRGQNVMLDRDLAALYGVETRALKQAVRRNLDRFPKDFMFTLSKDEFRKWRSQSVMSTARVGDSTTTAKR